MGAATGPGQALRWVELKPQIASMLLSDPTPLITMPVIPVVTIERAADAIPLARALLAGGLSVVEITLRTPAALEAVRAIIAEVKEIIVGVGTVVKPLDVTH